MKAFESVYLLFVTSSDNIIKHLCLSCVHAGSVMSLPCTEVFIASTGSITNFKIYANRFLINIQKNYCKHYYGVTMKKFCLALDLKEEKELIEAYDNWHKKENAWQEVQKSITDAGIRNMEIYRTGNRLFMIMETQDDFDPKKKAAMDAANPKVQEWEKLMGKFQQPLPWAHGEKWVTMNKIFQLP